MGLISFYFFSLVAVVSAILVLSFRNTLSSGIALVVTLASIACLFAQLGAHFLAAMQVLVYAGAIMVLFVFVIMMLNLGQKELMKIKIGFGSVLGILFGSYLGILLITRLGFLSHSFGRLETADYGSVREVGRLLFTQYLIPFEVASLLLVVAVVGAVVLAKR